MPLQGKWNDDFSDPVSSPEPGIAFQRIRAVPLELIEHHVSDSLPQRGIAYQPRVQPWESAQKNKPAF